MLVLIGCNHRSAPVAFRERLGLAVQDTPATLDRLRGLDGIDEAVVLSTCNRVELVVRGEGAPEPGTATLKDFLSAESGITIEELDRHAYFVTGLTAVRHLFRVAAGLDSMILGEPQILGQVKEAYRIAKGASATGTVLERLLQQCLGAAKRIRTETGISRNAVSVAYAAVHLARQIFGDLDGRRALLIGSGKMTTLVAKHLQSSGVGQVTVTSRTYNHAVELARRVDGQPVNWEQGFDRLGEVEIIVSCTASPHTVLDRAQVAAAMRRRRGQPLFIIDIAVPRDVDPAVNELDNVYLYDIDGLQGVVDAGLRERQRAAEFAEKMIDDEVQGFDRWRQSLEIAPTIVSLREHVMEVARRESERHRRKLGPLTAAQQEALQAMTRGLVQKLLHHPVRHLRKSVERGDVDASTSLYREIFGLEVERPADAPEKEQLEQGSGPRRLLRGGKDENA
jgi:glutamyl-tRNA reductase